MSQIAGPSAINHRIVRCVPLWIRVAASDWTEVAQLHLIQLIRAVAPYCHRNYRTNPRVAQSSFIVRMGIRAPQRYGRC